MASSRNNVSPDRFLDSVASCLRRHFPTDSSKLTLAVGFSGGRDSVALLFALMALQPGFGYRLVACHVNHGLSPNACRWQEFCQRFCDRMAIPLEAVSVDVPRTSAEGLEAAARNRRYEVFAKLSADWLLLGQHQGDQAETLLFNLLRGSGLKGAGAIPETRSVRPGLQLIRPLLGATRCEIEAYLCHHNLAWVDDESNSDTRFSRNFLRHRVLRELASRFPAAEANLAAAASRFAEAQVLLDDLALLDLGGVPAHFPLSVAKLTSLPETRGRNLLRFLLARHSVRIPSEARLREALRQLQDAKVDRHPQVVFGGWRLVRKCDQVLLEKILGNDP